MAAFFLFLGVERQHFTGVLKSGITAFDMGLETLQFGEKTRSIPAESNRDVIKALDRMRKIWAHVRPPLQRARDSSVLIDNDFPVLTQHETTLFTRAEQLTKRLVTAYRKSDLPTHLAVSIEVTGRLRALSQKMLKEVMLIGFHYEPDVNRETLAETMDQFESILLALMGKLPGISLPTPPKAVQEKLVRMDAQWVELKPFVQTLVEMDDIDTADLIKLSGVSDVLLGLTQEMLDIYTRDARGA